MVPLTLAALTSMCITPEGKRRAAKYLAPLNECLPAYRIDTAVRVAAFLAQVLHESGEFRYTRELGNSAYLARYDTGKLAKQLGNTPAADGDGQLYRGRGLLQVTGLANYSACGAALGLDLVARPELLEQPQHAVESACWYWTTYRDLNRFADSGDFLTLTRRINGGTNGLNERLAYWERARSALGVAA